MARPLRIEYPGAFYHIINRGNAGESIYADDRDRRKFLDYLETSVKRFTIVIHAYCLMTTHYHLIVETPNAKITYALLGQRFGGISGAVVTLTCNKVVRNLKQNKHLRIKLEEIKKQILNI